MAKDTNYVSEIDKFVANLLQERPDLIDKQKVLRNTWWDRGFIDQAEQKSFDDSATPKHGYAYFDYSNEVKQNSDATKK